MKTMIHNLSKRTKSVLAVLLAFVMVFGIVAVIAPVEAQALEINASDAGFYNVAYGTDGKTTFGTGTKIRVLNQTLIDKNKGKSDAVYTLGADGWTTDGALVWDGTGENTIYGVYPYNASYDAFPIPTDQSGGVQDADWMTASYTGAKTNSVNLNFSHLLTKVTINVTTWNSEYGSEEQTISNAKIYSLATDIKKNDDGTATANTAQLTGITPLKDGSSYTAIICPGKYTLDQTIMTFTVNNEVSEHTVLAKNNAVLTDGLQPGNHYTFNLTVGKESVSLSSVRVTPWAEKDIFGGVAEEVVNVPATVSTVEELNAAIKDGAYIVLSDNADIETISIPENIAVTIDLNGKSISKMTIADGANVMLVNSSDIAWSSVNEIEIGAASITMGELTYPQSKVVLNSKDAKLDFSQRAEYLEIVVQADGCSTSQFTIPAMMDFYSDSALLSVVTSDQLTAGTSYYVGMPDVPLPGDRV